MSDMNQISMIWTPDDPAALLGQVLAVYRSALHESPDALAYLAARHLADPQLLDAIGVGFADRTLARCLPPALQVHGRQVRVALKQLGILRSTGHGQLNGAIVVPITDGEGRVVDVYGRRIARVLPPRTERHVFLHEPPCGVFRAGSADSAGDHAVLCGSVFDALSFRVAGVPHAIACHGPDRVTDAHIDALLAGGARRVSIAFRRSDEGDRAADQLAARLQSAGADVFRVEFPLGQDANDVLIASDEPPETRFGRLLRAAVWLGRAASPSVAPSPSRPAPVPAQTPDAATPDAPAHELVHEVGGRRYRVRGLASNLSYGALRVNVMVSAVESGAFHVDTVDLYAARQRSAYIQQAARELHIEQDAIKADLGQLLLRLEALQDERIRAALEVTASKPVAMSEPDRQAALELLRDPQLIERIGRDFAACGVVGESTNLLVAYIAATSRKLEQPLAVVIQSSSASGKSALMNSVLELMPEDEQVKFSAITPQSLYYLGEHDLRHKILAIIEEEGAERASYPLKLLQSEGELSIATTGKDVASGRIRTLEYRVRGPVMILLTTTASDLDEELLDRCLVLATDEERAQTQAIHRHQRHGQTLAGLMRRRERGRVRQVHRNAQRLLRPLAVVNPFAEQLTFVDDRTRTRRDHLKYLTLIRAIALLHQYQRPVQTTRHAGEALEYIEVTAADIALANKLARHVLDRSLDELAPQTRRLLSLLRDLVRSRDLPEGLFTRRDVIEHTRWSYRQIAIHLRRLRDLEYVEVDRGGLRHRYRLLVEPASEAALTTSGLAVPAEGQ